MKENFDFEFINIEIMKRLIKHNYIQPHNYKVISILKKFKVLVKNIKDSYEKHDANLNFINLEDIKNFVMNNQTTETLFCWYKFEIAKEMLNKYFWDGLITDINHYIVIYQQETNSLKEKQIKIFIDESGNTGQIKINIKNRKFNYGNNRYITLGMLFLDSERVEQELITKYKNFRKKFKINTELKGNDLLIRENNNKLDYFLENMVNESFFAISLDKKYFICMEILHLLYNLDAKVQRLKHLIASSLVDEDDKFFSQYIFLLENPTNEQLYNFLNFLIKHKYKENFDKKYREEIISRCIFLLDNKNYLKIVKNIQNPLINIKGKKYYHVPNFDLIIHGLDTIFNFSENPFQRVNNEIILYHDNMEELKFYLEEKFNCLEPFLGINVKFKLQFLDSDNLLIQLIDNFTSIFNKLVKTVLTEKNITLNFFTNNLWSFKKISVLLKKISLNNINCFFPLEDKILIEILFILADKNKNLFNLKTIKKLINDLKKTELENYDERIKQSIMLDLLLNNEND
ncbi:MAG: hypothetical protein ACRC8P_00450 [Spiroplasma sp.]